MLIGWLAPSAHAPHNSLLPLLLRSLPQSPSTSTQLAQLNARIQAAAAADLRYERRQGGAPHMACAAAAAAGDGPQAAHRAVRSIRLC